ncbi:GNAT family N-acetyltransferase [Vibrio sonorensis]|uniref:GNAT family N-acetyltransferase n=1 Tax=Vibrio sonorensis TaxID=1004316 RepID=UPI0008D92FD3|nr:GNAT family N-acetyltransferase [Vibrio sonorensis]
MELIKANQLWKSSFQEMYQDFLSHDPENANFYRDGVLDYSRYVKSLEDESQGINLKSGYVPCSHFWLIEEKSILGVIRIRHHINNEFLSFEGGHIGYDVAPSHRGKGHGKTMLRLALPAAKALGIQTALITADEDNYASRKIIEANGGVFDKVIQGKVFPEPIARYWLKIE